MMETKTDTLIPSQAGVMRARCLKQAIGSDNVGLYEVARRVYRSINMAFCRKVHDYVRLCASECIPHCGAIANVRLNEMEPRARSDWLK
jgi:hypothetical protein